ncbi:unnamed protein product [Rhizophagus irregularis]|nr:unnamed protein product [Rhizophagus irregularis]
MILYNHNYHNSNLLFNAYYDSSYNNSDQSFNSYHNSLYDSFNPILDFSYDFSDLFLENHEKDNRIQIENECMVKNHQKENNNKIQMEVEDHSEDYCGREYDDDSE